MALPYRFTHDAALEILLLTTRRSKRWIIPKGWRPQTRPPSKQRQAERIVKIMRELAKREADARSMLTPRPDLMRAWFAKAA